MSDIKFTVNVDEYLSLNKYEVDESNAHIELVEDPSDEEFDKLILVCPAALYKRDEDGKKSFDYAGCLECGTCRIACGDTIIKKWENPQPTMGVEVPLRLSQARYIAYKKKRSLRAPFFSIRPRRITVWAFAALSALYGVGFALGRTEVSDQVISRVKPQRRRALRSTQILPWLAAARKAAAG